MNLTHTRNVCLLGSLRINDSDASREYFKKALQFQNFTFYGEILYLTS